MPRRIAQTLPSTLSRLLQGNYLKQAPLVLPVLALHPPAPLPPRAAVPRADLPQLAAPSLAPRKIVYLEDRVRRRFFHDHPWETARPRSLTEAEKTKEVMSKPGVVDLRNWGPNPSAEE
jgi:small subunit ribosomal protein S23